MVHQILHRKREKIFRELQILSTNNELLTADAFAHSDIIIQIFSLFRECYINELKVKPSSTLLDV